MAAVICEHEHLQDGDGKYPDIVQIFYSDCQVVDISKDKSNLKGNCNKCKKTITGGWKPSC